ncbi:PREDICTED: WPP domain-interacting tail-anchored protein 1 [Camelina sativa]|uniref:WPP domain-interacting tail-anchored protein 1 n=1 Tax=Camelina sativa TaxID=90675 RepID=A0ABM0VA28_CAMSA|nr:PREDICTED: WPP domain-interacting tail-anchored protein 1 [Camelina sativa]
MMETETEHHRTVSVDDNDSLVPEPSSTTKESFFEDFSLTGQVMNPQLSSAGEVLTKVELDFAFVSEKLVNLSLLTMQLGTRENDFESFVSKKVEEEEEEPSSNDDDSAEKALEFDLLSSILNSEVKELESLLGFLQDEIQSARVMISPFQHDGEAFLDLEGNLHDAEQSLAQLMDQVVEMKKQSSNFQRLSSGLDEFGSWSGGQTAVSQNDGEFGDLSAKIKMQTADQQRNVLRMLEKSLAKEMELEKKLSESRNTERELEMKLYSSEQDVVYMEEVTEDAFSRWLESDNAAEVFKGTSKEMSGKLQVLQFNLSGSFKREDNLKSELVNSKERLEAKECALHKLDSSNARLHDFLMAQTEGLKESLREAEEKMILLNTENSSLSEKVSSLEDQLNEYGLQTEDADATSGALIKDLERINEELKDKLAKTEARAEEAESKCKNLEESQKELQDELGTFRDKGFTLEKLASLEKHLRDSDLQLEHAVAAVEASKEKQNLLYSTVSDMEDVIDDLKSKVLKAENRADYTEEKLIMVSESNAELNEELKFFKGRLKEGEKYLQQAEERKIRTAKDIALHNKIMKKLVMQLAAERERLHKQITSLSRENCVLMVKLKKIGKSGIMESGNGNELSAKSDQNASSCHQESSPQATVTSVVNPEEEETELKSDIGSVRRLDVGALGLKHILVAMLVILLSSMAYFISQQNI